MGCRGTLKKEYGEFVVMHQHNHGVNINIEAKATFIRELKIAIQVTVYVFCKYYYTDFFTQFTANYEQLQLLI